MNLRSSKKTCLFILLMITAMNLASAWAWGPLMVTGPGAAQQGQLYHWNINPPYRTDLGLLGNQTNTQANSIVTSAFQVWQNVSTANISLTSAGQLSRDITSSTYLSFYNSLLNCSDTTQPTISIIYDVDGSIMTALGLDNNSTLGITEALCVDQTNGYITRGWSVMNGRFIDGQPNTSSHQTITLAQFQTVFTHEFGHLLGLDHSQINANCLTSCTADELAGVPMMFPILLDGVAGTLKTDDIAAISTLYPKGNFSTTTGRIQGSVYFSDGTTPAQGYNVIARNVNDPKKTAVSSVSGYLFTAAAGNTLVPLGAGGSRADAYSYYGSRDQSLLGYYDIPGLPPGTYTVEAEAINNSGDIPFVDTSSVGPIGSYYAYQYKIPGTCSVQYLRNPSLPSDNCSAYSTVAVGSGSIINTNTNVIFLGTLPTYDAWENGP